MQLALKPYVTTGVAIVGASVIAVSPIVPTPTEIHLPNPVTVVDRGVQLTANEIENAVNQLVFAATSLGVRIATLPAPLVAQLLDTDTQTASELLALGALGLGGPLISGPGAIGHAVQDVVNQLGSFDIEELINTLIGVPATIIDGFVNGGFGPNVDSLALKFGIPFFAGGLISELSLGTVPGTFPALQVLVDEILGVLGIEGPSAVTPNGEGAIEGAVNALVLNLVARPIVAVAGIVGTILAPILGQEAAAGLPVAALGLLGPLVSGPGAFGTAVQDVVDSLGSGNLTNVLNAVIGAPATLIDGVVNGGYGPNLAPLLSLPGLPPFPVVAGGLIPNRGFLYLPELNGLGVGLLTDTFIVPGIIPTLQGLASQIFGSLPGASALSGTTVDEMSISNTDLSNQRKFTLNVESGLGEDTGAKQGDPFTAKGENGGTGSGSGNVTSQAGSVDPNQGGSGNVANPVKGDENEGDEHKFDADLDKNGADLTGKLNANSGNTNGAGTPDMATGAKFEPEKKGDETENKNDGSGPVTTTDNAVNNDGGAPVNTAPGPESSEGGDE
jgi:hypothetical protein